MKARSLRIDLPSPDAGCASSRRMKQSRDGGRLEPRSVEKNREWERTSKKRQVTCLMVLVVSCTARGAERLQSLRACRAAACLVDVFMGRG